MKYWGKMEFSLIDTLYFKILYLLGFIRTSLKACLNGRLDQHALTDFFFFEKEEYPRPLHLVNAYGQFIKY